ncbi:MAG TPA: hypothetical protein VF493_12405 [Terriglobales bacterium]
MSEALMAADENRVFMALGALQSEIKNLRDEFVDLKEKFTEDHNTVTEIVRATNEAVRNLNRTVEEMKPLTDDYREKRAEARGAARLAGWLYTAAGVVGGLVVWAGGRIVDWLTVRPHP